MFFFSVQLYNSFGQLYNNDISLCHPVVPLLDLCEHSDKNDKVAWQLLKRVRKESEHYGVLEPLFFNPLFKTNSPISSTVVDKFLKTGIATVIDLIDSTKGQWHATRSIADQVGLRSGRYVEGLIEDLKKSFPQSFLTFVNLFFENGEKSLTFPDLRVEINFELDEDLNNTLLLKGFKDVSFQNVEKKMLYGMCVKSLFYAQLKKRTDTKWREYLLISSEITPSWRCFYKPPIPKRSGDLQWRILHCAVATNSFVSKFNAMVSSACPFCNAIDTVFHFFSDCFRLTPLFELLDKIFTELGFMFTKNLFILGLKYKKERMESTMHSW